MGKNVGYGAESLHNMGILVGLTRLFNAHPNQNYFPIATEFLANGEKHYLARPILKHSNLDQMLHGKTPVPSSSKTYYQVIDTQENLSCIKNIERLYIKGTICIDATCDNKITYQDNNLWLWILPQLPTDKKSNFYPLQLTGPDNQVLNRNFKITAGKPAKISTTAVNTHGFFKPCPSNAANPALNNNHEKETSCLTLDDEQAIVDFIKQLEKECESWFGRFSGLKDHKIRGLRAILTECKTQPSASAVIEQVKQQYKHLCDGFISSRTADLLNKIQNNKPVRQETIPMNKH